MVRSIIKSCLYTYNRISGKRSLGNTFLKSLFYSREVVLRNSAAYNNLLKFKRALQIAGRLKTHLNVTILAMSAGLFFMLAFHIGILADSLTERNLRFGKFDVYFITLFQFIYHDIKMLVTHTIEKCLSVGRIVLCTEGLILTCHL